MPFKKIVLLAGEWETTPVVYHFIKENFGLEKVVMERPVPRKDFLRRRIKKLGFVTVAGQVLFQLLVAKGLGRRSRPRIDAIPKAYGLHSGPLPDSDLVRVSSVNAAESLEVLKSLQPDLVIVHGTRIISKKVLQEIRCPFVNIHSGITPRYRGSHGAYWALAAGDRAHCGVTVHLVDAGIDTGNILGQATIPLTAEDNFATYPYLQLAEGLRLLQGIVPRLAEGTLTPMTNDLNSALWHHPTLWGYWYTRLVKRVR